MPRPKNPEGYYDTSDEERVVELDMSDDERMKYIFIKANRRAFNFDNTEVPKVVKQMDRRFEKERELSEPFLHKSFLLHVYFSNIRPKIWRQIRVPGSMTLASFHDKVLCPALGWMRNYHAYYFKELPYRVTETEMGLVIGPIRSGAVDYSHVGMAGLEFYDDQKVRIGQVLHKEGQKIEYMYDLGDQFRHKIVVEKIEDFDSKTMCVVDLLAGERACPAEDSSGNFGYAKKLEQIKNKKSDYLESMHSLTAAVNNFRRDLWDPEFFDLEGSRARLMLALKTPLSYNNGQNMASMSFTPGAPSHIAKFKETLGLVVRKKCQVCGVASELRCGKCRVAYYCGRDHQKGDWSQHKKVCCQEPAV